MSDGRIAVIGEAIVDVVETGDDEPRQARPGGGPYNIAIGLARLERPAAFVGRLSRDPLGEVLRRHAQRSKVDLSLAVDAREPSTVALVTLDAGGAARYRFGADGTADFRFSAAELARIPDDVAAVHFGSLTSWVGPGDVLVAERVAQLRAAGVAVSYDPNVRPQLQPDRAVARAQVESAVGLAHLVKTSDEDLDWLYPGRPASAVAAEWLTRGPGVVVVTHGADGADAFTAHGSVHRDPAPVEVIDTVGAGDAFMSGLLDSLAGRGLLAASELDAAPPLDALAGALDDAGRVAALTCARAGANPPRRADLDAR